jgi:hypothetical protein
MNARPEAVAATEGKSGTASRRADALARVLEQGASALAAFAETLSDAEWQMPVSATDRRKIGVIVYHVASIYPLEVQLAQKLAGGGVIDDVTWDNVHELNAGVAKENDGATKAEALALLKKNSAEAAAALRAVSDSDLDRIAPNSLYGNAPMTCQFMFEDHAVRHSYHHLAKIRAALKR